MTTKAEQKELSDDELYDLAWEDEDGTAPSAKTGEDEGEDGSDDAAAKANATPPAGAAEVGAEQGTENKGGTETPAEENSAADPWATVPAELRQAYLKVQNDFKSVVGRHTAAERKAADQEKELARLRKEKAELTRTKGTYETEHPELFNEVLSVVEARVAPTPAPKDEPADDDAIKTVFRIHKDVNTVMASPEWAEFVNGLNDAQAALFNSDDPYEFADLVTEFKVTKAARSSAPKAKQTPDSELLAAAAAPSGKAASKPAARTFLTAQEAYDAEWDKDD